MCSENYYLNTNRQNPVLPPNPKDLMNINVKI